MGLKFSSKRAEFKHNTSLCKIKDLILNLLNLLIVGCILTVSCLCVGMTFPLLGEN